jgi:hypothetical protein
MVAFFIDMLPHFEDKKEYIKWTILKGRNYLPDYRIAIGFICPEYIPYFDKLMLLR